MRLEYRVSMVLWGALALVSSAACSAESDPSPGNSGSGASTGSGATTSAGGTTATGSGGTTSTTGAGGSVASAGGTTSIAGAGGSVASAGGTTGAGGASGGSSGAGAGGTAGAGTAVFSYTFDANEEGFTVLTGVGASVPDELQTEATVSFLAAAETGGGLAFAVPFGTGTGAGATQQNVSVAVAAPELAPWDLTGKTVTARVRLASGLTADGENPGGVYVFLKGGTDWKFARGAWHNAGVVESTAGTWFTLTFTPSTPTADDYVEEGFSVTDVKMVGIAVLTGGAGVYTDAAVEIDTIQAQ